MLKHRLPGGHGTVTTVSADGRECPARLLAGDERMSVSGLAVLATSSAAAREALDWIPGRILVLADEALSSECFAMIKPRAHPETFAAVVLLNDDLDLRQRAWADAAVPVVAVTRDVDQDCIRRALRLVIQTRDPADEVVDLRSLPRPRRHRAAHPIRLGQPGTVAH